MRRVIRGQEVEIIDKDIFITIHKPLGGVFSISDILYNYLQDGFTVTASFPDGTKRYLTKQDVSFKKEPVKSKFPNASDWHRYWYRVKAEQKQEELFDVK